jgi:hypothetical protein
LKEIDSLNDGFVLSIRINIANSMKIGFVKMNNEKNNEGWKQL